MRKFTIVLSRLQIEKFKEYLDGEIDKEDIEGKIDDAVQRLVDNALEYII